MVVLMVILEKGGIVLEETLMIVLAQVLWMFPCAEFQKEIHMRTKEEDAKQSYYMAEILEEIRELHTLVSKIISKNKGKFT